MSRVTRDYINELEENEVFVFGSNKQGMHFGGAAYFAYQKFGAKMGVGEGLTGQSYALPTMEGKESFKEAVSTFIAFAKENPTKKFLVTKVGCGIAGYAVEDVAPMFAEAIDLVNVFLPQEFWEFYSKKNCND